MLYQLGAIEVSPSDALRFAWKRDLTEGDLAAVLLKAVQMPEARGLRFDLCVDAAAPADGDWARLFEEAVRVARS